MFGACVSHCFKGDGDACIGCKGLTVFLLFNGLLMSIGWSKWSLLSSTMVLVMRVYWLEIWMIISLKVLWLYPLSGSHSSARSSFGTASMDGLNDNDGVLCVFSILVSGL